MTTTSTPHTIGVVVSVTVRRPWWKRLFRRDRTPVVTAVTYGGVAMTRIGSGSSYSYFLGTDIPTES